MGFSRIGAAAILRRPAVLAGVLALVTGLLFLPSVNHGFITYDDPAYVVHNTHVNAGLSWAGIRWAFTSLEGSNWHPLTWLSHMLDCQLFGLWPGGHHLSNTLLHALNTAFLVLALQRLTGATWPSLAVGALFGMHPLRVESVAWVAERKDVLSTFFFVLVLWVWAIRAQRLGEGGRGTRRLYAGALVLFACGLMAKPMLVTLPCVLLLLDVWPLRRWPGASWRGRGALVLEKVPFLVLSTGSSVVTLVAQRAGGAVGSIEEFTPWVRVGNALVAYVGYLSKCFWPVDLAVFYPNFAESPPLARVVFAGTALAGVSAAVVLLRRRQPWLAVGWFWFLGTLVPVIGFVQVGGQTMADRYSYIPLIGVFIMVAWTLEVLVRAWPRARVPVVALAAAAVVACAWATSLQLARWRTPVDLFRHTAAVTENNWVAHHNLAIALAEIDPAAAQLARQETLRILAEFAARYHRRGVELAGLAGREDEAEKQFRTAIQILRILPEPHFQLGLLLARRPERAGEAARAFATAVQLKPDFAEAWLALGTVLAGSPDHATQAQAALERAVALRPDLAEAHYNIAVLLLRQGRTQEARRHVERAVQIRPDFTPARELLARLEGRGP